VVRSVSFLKVGGKCDYGILFRYSKWRFGAWDKGEVNYRFVMFYFSRKHCLPLTQAQKSSFIVQYLRVFRQSEFLIFGYRKLKLEHQSSII